MGWFPYVALDMEVPQESLRARYAVFRAASGTPASDADLERGQVILEVNRKPVASVRQFQQLTGTLKTGDVLAVFVYLPGDEQRALRTLRIDAP